MDKDTRHAVPGFMDLFLTMGPKASKPWIERIDALPHGDKCCLLEEFEWAKERYPHYHRARQYRLDGRVRRLLYRMLEHYWSCRKEYSSGYYYEFLTDPKPGESTDHYVRRMGPDMLLLSYYYVRSYQKEGYVDIRYALMMRRSEERDRICDMIRSVSADLAALIRNNWQTVVDNWLWTIGDDSALSFDTLEKTRTVFDNYVFMKYIIRNS